MFQKLLASALAATTLLFGASAMAFDTEMLENNGNSANRVNIIIVGDGYRKQDQDLLREHAKKITAKLWSNPAFKNYRSYFNVKLIKTESQDDGAISGNNPPTKSTIFKSFFNCHSIDRLLCIGDTGRLTDVLEEDAPEYDSRFDIVLVTVNDSKYGGAGGAYATTSAEASAPEIAVHEIGHSFANLADEYDYGNTSARTTEFSEPNATIQTKREKIKWSSWIEDATPIPTPETAAHSTEVGLFEGAAYYTDDQYRPSLDCKMKELGDAFCPVCGEAIVTTIYTKTDPIETRSPSASTVTLLKNASRTFSFNGPRPAPDTLGVSWWVDGVKKASNVKQLTVSGSSLSVGNHTVEVRVKDGTTMVRKDDDGVLASKFKWKVTVTQPQLPTNPDPPDSCGVAKKCCEPGPNGSCLLCVPNANACP